jgi:hypothetical protein
MLRAKTCSKSDCDDRKKLSDSRSTDDTHAVCELHFMYMDAKIGKKMKINTEIDIETYYPR